MQHYADIMHILTLATLTSPIASEMSSVRTVIHTGAQYSIYSIFYITQDALYALDTPQPARPECFTYYLLYRRNTELHILYNTKYLISDVAETVYCARAHTLISWCVGTTPSLPLCHLLGCHDSGCHDSGLRH